MVMNLPFIIVFIVITIATFLQNQIMQPKPLHHNLEYQFEFITIYILLSILIDDLVTWRSKLPDFSDLFLVSFSNIAESTTKLRV